MAKKNQYPLSSEDLRDISYSFIKSFDEMQRLIACATLGGSHADPAAEEIATYIRERYETVWPIADALARLSYDLLVTAHEVDIKQGKVSPNDPIVEQETRHQTPKKRRVNHD
jgi:hypothetical protein